MSEEYAATEAKFKISDVLDLSGATSIGRPSPIKEDLLILHHHRLSLV